MLATMGATTWLYVIAPKGLFPQQDTGLIIGVAKAAPDVSFDAMSERIQRLGHIVMTDPDVDNVHYWIGQAGTLSQGRMLINLKPFANRDATATQVMNRLKQRVADVEYRALHAGPSGHSGRWTHQRDPGPGTLCRTPMSPS